jgi:hypothetical protein
MDWYTRLTTFESTVLKQAEKTEVSLIVPALKIFLTKWNEITTQCFQRADILGVAGL